MNSEDFFAFAYPAFAILGVLLSGIPAYIASKKNKSFWLWWISTAAIFMILLFLVIKNQAISLLIYLLAIVPVVSILALLPKLNYRKPFLHMSDSWAAIKSNRFRGVYPYLLIFILAGILYRYLSPQDCSTGCYGDSSYPAILAVVFLTACLGYMWSIFIFSRRKTGVVFIGFLLTFLLSLPVLLDRERAFSVLQIWNLIAPKVDLGSVIAALMSKPIGGIFILFGLCSLPGVALILFNDKYGVINGVASILRSDDFSPPYIHFSKIRSTPVLVLCILYLIFFKVLYHPTEGWIFLLPLIWLCFYLPMLLIAFAGTLLSSLVIGISINQKRNLYALGIFLCGVLAVWKSIPTPWDRLSFELPVMLLVFYGIGSGSVALILWVISDSRGPREIDGSES